ncbi:hypothetical protein [Streptomyces acidicola]|uniref:hypothetical protein n=1 Tax=Streptomyces acidicola TaxID=2596892 RepID=UPI00382592FD
MGEPAGQGRAEGGQSVLALGVATRGTLFLFLFLPLVPDMGMRDALVRTLLAQLAGVALTIALSVRLPRRVGQGGAAEEDLDGR